MDKIPIILLAAGGSTRMESPKQLLLWGNQTLIEYQIQVLRKTENPVNIVLGAHAESVIPVVKKYDLNIFINKDWESGMGSSIAYGIEEISKKYPQANAAMITLLDQPLVTTDHLNKILKVYLPYNSQIIVSQSSAGWSGVPALFDRIYFNELKNLSGEQGAKSIIQNHLDSVLTIQCEDILTDMDTPESYQKMLSQFKNNQSFNSP